MLKSWLAKQPMLSWGNMPLFTCFFVCMSVNGPLFFSLSAVSLTCSFLLCHNVTENRDLVKCNTHAHPNSYAKTYRHTHYYKHTTDIFRVTVLWIILCCDLKMWIIMREAAILTSITSPENWPSVSNQYFFFLLFDSIQGKPRPELFA